MADDSANSTGTRADGGFTSDGASSLDDGLMGSIRNPRLVSKARPDPAPTTTTASAVATDTHFREALAARQRLSGRGTPAVARASALPPTGRKSRTYRIRTGARKGAATPAARADSDDDSLSSSSDNDASDAHRLVASIMSGASESGDEYTTDDGASGSNWERESAKLHMKNPKAVKASKLLKWHGQQQKSQRLHHGMAEVVATSTRRLKGVTRQDSKRLSKGGKGPEVHTDDGTEGAWQRASAKLHTRRKYGSGRSMKMSQRGRSSRSLVSRGRGRGRGRGRLVGPPSTRRMRQKGPQTETAAKPSSVRRSPLATEPAKEQEKPLRARPGATVADTAQEKATQENVLQPAPLPAADPGREGRTEQRQRSQNVTRDLSRASINSNLSSDASQVLSDFHRNSASAGETSSESEGDDEDDDVSATVSRATLSASAKQLQMEQAGIKQRRPRRRARQKPHSSSPGHPVGSKQLASKSPPNAKSSPPRKVYAGGDVATATKAAVSPRRAAHARRKLRGDADKPSSAVPGKSVSHAPRRPRSAKRPRSAARQQARERGSSSKARRSSTARHAKPDEAQGEKVKADGTTEASPAVRQSPREVHTTASARANPRRGGRGRGGRGRGRGRRGRGRGVSRRVAKGQTPAAPAAWPSPRGVDPAAALAPGAATSVDGAAEHEHPAPNEAQQSPPTNLATEYPQVLVLGGRPAVRALGPQRSVLPRSSPGVAAVSGFFPDGEHPMRLQTDAGSAVGGMSDTDARILGSTDTLGLPSPVRPTLGTGSARMYRLPTRFRDPTYRPYPPQTTYQVPRAAESPTTPRSPSPLQERDVYELFGSMRYGEEQARARETSHQLWDLIKSGKKVKVVTEEIPVPTPEPSRAETGKLLVKAFMTQQTQLNSSKKWRKAARDAAKDAFDASKRADNLEKRVNKLKVQAIGWCCTL